MPNYCKGDTLYDVQTGEAVIYDGRDADRQRYIRRDGAREPWEPWRYTARKDGSADARLQRHRYTREVLRLAVACDLPPADVLAIRAECNTCDGCAGKAVN